MRALFLFLLIACGNPEEQCGPLPCGTPCTMRAVHNYCACGAAECTACLPDVLTEFDGRGTVQWISCEGR